MDTLNLCLAANNNYAMQTGVTVVSFLENHKKSKTDIYIIQNDFNMVNISLFGEIEKRYNTNIIMIDPGEVLKKVEGLKFMDTVSKNGVEYAKKMGAAAYSRLFITELIPRGVNKVLYVDSDIIFHGSALHLFEVELKGGIGAVVDVWPSSYNKQIGLDESIIYYSAGVQIIDLQYMRKNHCQELIWEFMNNMEYQYRLFDQDIMNILFSKEITRLPLEYNMMAVSRLYSPDLISKMTQKDDITFYTKDEQEYAKKNAKIYHFAGDLFGKPWNFPYANRFSREWYYYFKKSPWSQNSLGKYTHNSIIKYRVSLLKNIIKKILFEITGINKQYENQVIGFIKQANEK